MTEVLGMVTALAGGALLGLLYFGGLWVTVQRLASTRLPGALALTSFVVRTAVVVAGLAMLMAGDARRLAMAVIGLLAVRVLAVRRARAGLGDAGGG
jgi:F1F0 ATPase subunit 2